MTPKEQILNIIAKGKIGGSWLISGSFGVGKRRFAAELATYLTTGKWIENYEYNKNVKWIQCSLTEEAKKEIQKMILAGKSVEETDKTTARKREITIDDIREGMQFLSLKPAKNEYKVLVIDRADDMNSNAANALLKVLEEPYQRSVLILLSENTGKLLPTICSRCRKILIPQLSYDEVYQQLSTLYPDFKYIDLIADLSNGSIGLGQKIYEEQGIELFQKMTSFFAPFNQIDIEKLNNFADTLVKEPENFKLFTIFWQNKLSERIKQEAPVNKDKTEKLLDIYEQSKKLFEQVDTLYLDKKQIIVTLFLSLSEVAYD